jgi:hypothetical protein
LISKLTYSSARLPTGIISLFFRGSHICITSLQIVDQFVHQLYWGTQIKNLDFLVKPENDNHWNRVRYASPRKAQESPMFRDIQGLSWVLVVFTGLQEVILE